MCTMIEECMKDTVAKERKEWGFFEGLHFLPEEENTLEQTQRMEGSPSVCLGGNIAGKVNICAKAEMWKSTAFLVYGGRMPQGNMAHLLKSNDWPSGSLCAAFECDRQQQIHTLATSVFIICPNKWRGVGGEAWHIGWLELLLACQVKYS